MYIYGSSRARSHNIHRLMPHHQSIEHTSYTKQSEGWPTLPQNEKETENEDEVAFEKNVKVLLIRFDIGAKKSNLCRARWSSGRAYSAQQIKPSVGSITHPYTESTRKAQKLVRSLIWE